MKSQEVVHALTQLADQKWDVVIKDNRGNIWHIDQIMLDSEHHRVTLSARETK